MICFAKLLCTILGMNLVQVCWRACSENRSCHRNSGIHNCY